MSINVIGSIISPVGVGILSTIRVTATSTGDKVIAGTSATITTAETGEYSFILEDGSYLIEINSKDEFEFYKDVVIDGAVLTNGSYTLNELITN